MHNERLQGAGNVPVPERDTCAHSIVKISVEKPWVLLFRWTG